MKTKHALITALLFAILTLPNLSWAIPVNWEFPSTVVLSGVNNSVSGSFTFDADTDTLSNMSLVVTLNGVATPIATAGSVDATYLRVVGSSTIGSPGIYIIRTTLTNAGGNVQIPQIGAGLCTSIFSGVCNNIGQGGTASSVSVIGEVVPTPPAAPISVPVDSIWLQIAMILMIIGSVAWYRRRTMK